MIVLTMKGENDIPKSLILTQLNDKKSADEYCKQLNDNSFPEHWIRAKVVDFNQWIPIEKPRVFYWEDIPYLDNQAIQVILRDVDVSELAVALVNAEVIIKRKFLSNFSRRAAQMLLEDMKYMGPVSKSLILIARRKFEDIVIKCLEENRITFNKDDEMIVDETEIKIEELYSHEEVNEQKLFVESSPGIFNRFQKWRAKHNDILKD